MYRATNKRTTINETIHQQFLNKSRDMICDNSSDEVILKRIKMDIMENQKDYTLIDIQAAFIKHRDMEMEEANIKKAL